MNFLRIKIQLIALNNFENALMDLYQKHRQSKRMQNIMTEHYLLKYIFRCLDEKNDFIENLCNILIDFFDEII